MRLLAFVLSAVLITAAGWVAGFVSSGPPHTVDALAFFALTVFACGPIAIGWIGSLQGGPNVQADRRAFSRLVWSMLAADLLAAVALVAHTVLVGNPAMVAVLIIAGAAALTAIAVPAGRFLARHAPADTDAQPGEPIDRAVIRRTATRAAVTFSATFLISLTAFVLVLAASRWETSVVWAIAQALVVAMLAAGLHGTSLTTRLNRRIRAIVEGDRASLIRIDKVVRRGKRLQLEDHEKEAAAKYAAEMKVFLPVQLAQGSFTLGAVLLQFVILAAASGSPLTIGAIVFIAAGTVLAAPLAIRQLARVRRYARVHSELSPYRSSPPVS